MHIYDNANRTDSHYHSTLSCISVVNPATDIDAWNQEEIYYVRDGLLDEGWFYHEKLPPSWMYKQGR